MLPWLELVVFGMAVGKWLLEDARQALEWAWKLGAVFVVAFVVVRYLDGFGNIRPRMGNRWIDYLNVVKYPPSIAFTLLTTGFNLLVLGLFGRVADKARALLWPLAVFGRVPLFYYVIHIYLAHLLAMLAGTLQGYPLRAWLVPHWLKPAGYGFGLPVVYLAWIGLVAALYPACSWYARLKTRKQKWYLSYL